MRFASALTIGLVTVVYAKVAPEWLQENHSTGDPPPSGRVDGVQTTVARNGQDGYNESQPADCPTIMIASALPDGNKDDGYQKLPTVAGFDLDRLVVDHDANATLPYYIENTKDLSKIKRVVITIPGAWRNVWKYVNNMRNSLVCAAARETVNADMDRILIAAPQWLNDKDVGAGAGEPSDIFFHQNSYQRGRAAAGPGGVDISSFEAMDMFVKTFWNKDVYPSLETVVVASHYAMLRPTQPDDPKMTFGVMNPGSFAWLVSDRPERDEGCVDTYDAWHYGIGDGKPAAFPKYIRHDALHNRSFIQERYISRNIFYGFGTADHGNGDTHCEAQWQGSTHIERGRNFHTMLRDLPGGFPGRHSVDYILGVSHQDYNMMVSEAMQRKLFLFDTAYAAMP
ncbi:hypothetical protein BDW59DRAFT_170512 [Aspergillus cavernicola]|uniref:Uncharacterized protein n=1 Tax=Aspergillus cavernicola TaxID=176166 RepID=A0ABR4IP10_9EURO